MKGEIKMRITHIKDSLKLVEFAQKYPNAWHNYAKDKKTLKAVERAVFLGRIITNEFNQFQLKGEN